MSTDASCIAPNIDAPRATPSTDLPAARRPVAGWRLLATLALLLLTLPVFAAAAAVCLPVLLLAAAAQGAVQIVALRPAPPRVRRLARTR